jgi:hypothetical protein
MNLKKKYLKYKSKYLQLKNQFGGEYPKCSTFDDLKKNPAHLAQFKTYLTQRKIEGKQNWLVTGAKYTPEKLRNEELNRNVYRSYTEASRFSNENWIFFDQGNNISTRYQFSGDATLVDNWKFLADNFNDLFHFITTDFNLTYNHEILKHMIKLLSINGVIMGNTYYSFRDLDVDIGYKSISNCNKTKLADWVYGVDPCFFYKVRNIDIVPFSISSGGGGRVQYEFFEKIHSNSSLLKHPRLDKELLELYHRLFNLETYKKPECITGSLGVMGGNITRLIHEYIFYCKNSEDKVLSELAERLFSEEIELKMYQFITDVSLEWRPPSIITLQNIWNDVPTPNAEVQLVNKEEFEDINIKKTYIIYKYGEE